MKKIIVDIKNKEQVRVDDKEIFQETITVLSRGIDLEKLKEVLKSKGIISTNSEIE